MQIQFARAAPSGKIKGIMFFEMLEEVVHAACKGRMTK
jgi:hypothetical protein